MGYVKGVVDSFNDIAFKIPSGVTTGQLCSVVGKYIDDHPSEWNQEAADLVIKALKKAFPKK